MIPAELSEALIEGLGDDVVVMVTGSEDSVEEGLQIEPGSYPPVRSSGAKVHRGRAQLLGDSHRARRVPAQSSSPRSGPTCGCLAESTISSARRRSGVPW
jgi:hypothetical protein